MMEDEHGRDVVVLEANDKAVKKFHSQYGDVLSAKTWITLKSDIDFFSDLPTNNSPLPLGIPSENHVHVDGHAKEAVIFDGHYHRKHYHGRRYGVKAKVTESADEGGNKKGNAGASGGDGGFGGDGGSGNGKKGGGSGNGGNRGLGGNPAPRSPRLNSNTAQNNPPSNKHNNVANFDASSCFLPWTEDPRSYLLSRLP
ncbi:hypothetical protein CNBC0330 [Cryptococcus deneoformans B-3501A]|uniref:hypothetical protein n=1 Tax=Cryptococcus deneoformans (strain B-3501A) TaxID=283643 RepID=UPI000042EB17|nr:hypothetical protein CNBC0330 [Cryptococcus neoformans var. neoformans B-3501A]EAL21892.1 hypothetical protein CNBC0330 [Cryptococcus neoformans var. neoformans B-3501A]